MLSFIRGKVPEPASFESVSQSSLASPLAGDAALLEDLVALGDGGLFMDRVITPVFVVITYEVGGWMLCCKKVDMLLSSGSID